jgi:glutathione S-transferase
VNLLKGAQREAAYRAINLMMALPALIDGEGPILFESLATRRNPNPPLLPRDARGRARVRGLAQIVACERHRRRDVGLRDSVSAAERALAQEDHAPYLDRGAAQLTRAARPALC